jgi:hypothetical protein
MGSRMFTFATTVALAGTVSAASAQAPSTTEPMTKNQIIVACAPPPLLSREPLDAPRIMGSQDVITRSSFGTPELLVINVGTNHGMQVNQQYFVRRLFRTAETHNDKLPHMVHTAGWVHIVAVNEAMSIARPDHVCSELRTGDFLEPFEAPAIPDGDILTPVTRGEQDFKNYSRVTSGPYDRLAAGRGEFIAIDHGSDRDITVGSHFAIWRDLQVTGMPLTAIGEATVVSVGPQRAMLIVTRARDAVFKDDIIVPRVEEGTAAVVEPAPAGTR